MRGSLGHLFQGKTHAEIRENTDKVSKLVKDGRIRFQNPDRLANVHTLSLRDLAESMLGAEGLATMMDQPSHDGYIDMSEAAEGVISTNFTNITGNLVFQSIVTAYQAPEFIGDQLFAQETSKRDNTREIGLANIDDDALVVPEATEFPEAKFGEDYIDPPKSVKRGMKCAITREMVFFDETGQVVKLATSIGERLGTNKEKRQLSVFLGLVNPFVRNGVARNTYVAASDPRINSLVGTLLTDWTSLDAVNDLFLNMTDDRTIGEPIVAAPDTLVVSPRAEWNVRRILTATDVRTNGTNSGTQPMATTQTTGANPVKNAYKVLTSQWLDWLLVQSGVSASNAAQYFTLLNSKRAFVYRTLFPLAVRAAPQNDVDEFDRDIVMKFRADERGVPYVRAPWYAVQAKPA